ncbi:MAG: hypothetical protein ACR2NR_11755 [Solirubrobacteraceae bacterium]
MSGERQFVFGYGSLAAAVGHTLTRERRADGFVVDLPGWVRGWGVAMDNRRDLPGYKYYTDADGSRPAVFVTFLDIRVGEGASNGLCLPVDRGVLEILDRRERNYVRLDVSDRIDALEARVWVYVGRPEARERLATARRADAAVIDVNYLRAVRAAFAALGGDELGRCLESLAPGDLPVVELTRHELP